MKNLVLHAKHILPIYDMELHLFVSRDAVVTYNRVCKAWNTDPEKGPGSGFKALSIADGDGGFAIFLHLDEITEKGVAHEVKHMADNVMKHIGANECKCAKEPKAYLIGYLSHWVKKVIKQHKLKVELV